MGSRTSVSLRPAIQATGLLAPAPAGLTPAEHISVTLDARELLKLGIDVAERTISRLLPKRPLPPSQTWRTFLTNHIQDLVSIDFFTVPLLSCGCSLSWSFSLTIAAESCTSTSPRIVLRDRDQV